MFDKVKTDTIHWMFLLGIILLIIEISFFNGAHIFFLLMTIGCMYIGYKRMPKTTGKLLFWGGLIILLITILNMMTFRLLLIAILIYILIQFGKSKKNPTYIQPDMTKNESVIDTDPFTSDIEKEPLFISKPFFKNVFIGAQQTPEQVYEWNDINVLGGIGDAIIDLSYTVLPKGESVIVIRHLVGKVQILVPYDIEVSVHHTAIAGATTIFQHEETKLFNQNLQFQTAEYEAAEQKIKIMTSMLSGDLEVKRV